MNEPLTKRSGGKLVTETHQKNPGALLRGPRPLYTKLEPTQGISLSGKAISLASRCPEYIRSLPHRTRTSSPMLDGSLHCSDATYSSEQDHYLCEICSGPHDTQYCMENPEQAFIEYASSRIDEAGDARLSMFEADFKQQQSEMTNKIDTVLKAITDRMA
ncbi:hypothetical protein Tco_0276601 [Tanacetum coccineum]